MPSILVAFFLFFPGIGGESHDQSCDPNVNEEFRYTASSNTVLVATDSQTPLFSSGRFTRTASDYPVTTDQGD
jgi:hypothetical protein